MSPDSALGFVLQIHQQLLQLDDQREEEVREALFQLYTGNKEPEKRRFLALTAVRQASDRDNEYIQYQFANTWASGVKKSDPERKFAGLFSNSGAGRAYLEDSRERWSRGYFFATTLQTGSLEGHIGFIEAWIVRAQGYQGHYAKQFKRNPEPHLRIRAGVLAGPGPSEWKSRDP